MSYDALIIGAGPAGLTAAIYLGRYLRPTLVLDRGKVDSPWFMPTTHNFFGFPAGVMREQLLAWGRAHAEQYESVDFRLAQVTRLERTRGGFRAHTADGQAFDGRGAIVATGESHALPDIPNIMAYAGRTVYHCPECDGFKARGRRLAVIGTGRATAGFSLKFRCWTDYVTLYTAGEPANMDPEAEGKLARANIRVVTEPIVAIEGDQRRGVVRGLRLASGETVPTDLMFTNYECRVYTDIVAGLGVKMLGEGYIRVDKHQQTNVRGLYAAGDVCAPNHKQLSIAIANGATAAINLHYALMPDELSLEDDLVRSYQDEGWLRAQRDQLPEEQQSWPEEARE